MAKKKAEAEPYVRITLEQCKSVVSEINSDTLKAGDTEDCSGCPTCSTTTHLIKHDKEALKFLTHMFGDVLDHMHPVARLTGNIDEEGFKAMLLVLITGIKIGRNQAQLEQMKELKL